MWIRISDAYIDARLCLPFQICQNHHELKSSSSNWEPRSSSTTKFLFFLFLSLEFDNEDVLRRLCIFFIAAAGDPSSLLFQQSVPFKDSFHNFLWKVWVQMKDLSLNTMLDHCLKYEGNLGFLCRIKLVSIYLSIYLSIKSYCLIYIWPS